MKTGFIYIPRTQADIDYILDNNFIDDVVFIKEPTVDLLNEDLIKQFLLLDKIVICKDAMVLIHADNMKEKLLIVQNGEVFSLANTDLNHDEYFNAFINGEL